MEAVLQDQWAVVTGASKGIGYGITERLVGAGANAVLVARDRSDLESAAARLRKGARDDQQLLVRSTDTSDPAAIADLFGWIADEIPALNVLVANAGSGSVVPFLEVTAEEWERNVALNLTGTFHCIQQAARLMVGLPEGTNRSIVAVSSVRALGIRPGLAPYAASKAGVNQLVRMAAYELGPHEIRVNALSPGITVTPLVEQTMRDNPELLEQRVQGIPMGRPGTPDDMGRAALFLCSPSSSFLTGTNTVVDGGESLY